MKISSLQTAYRTASAQPPTPPGNASPKEPQDEVQLGGEAPRTMPAINPLSVGVGFSFGGGIGTAIGLAAGKSAAAGIVGAGIGAVALTAVLGALTSKIPVE